MHSSLRWKSTESLRPSNRILSVLVLAAACGALLSPSWIDAQAPGILTTVAGDGSPNCNANTGANCFGGDDGLATSAELYSPYAVVVGHNGTLYIADSGNNRIRMVDAKSGEITTIAGDGSPDCNTSTGGANCYGGDNGPATKAQLYYPFGLALDGQGDLYIADTGNNRVRMVNLATGTITTVAGDGSPGCDANDKADCFGGDGHAAASAHLWLPFGVAFDQAGNYYIADTNNNRIRKVNLKTGIITTVAGNGSCSIVDSYRGCYSGDNGLATKAELWSPAGVFADPAGNLYIADEYNNRVRMVNALTGIITSVAGDGYLTCNSKGDDCTGGYNGDGIPATSAELNFPFNVILDSAGSIYIAEYDSNRIRRVDGSTQMITTVAGNGTAGYKGDGGQGNAAELNQPTGVVFDNLGNLLIADAGNNVVRKMQGTPADTPLIGPATGDYAAPLSVSIIDATPNATIYYAVNGDAWSQYSSPIKVVKTETITAYAIAVGFAQSATAVGTFTIEPLAATPSFAPAGGTFGSEQQVALADATAGAAIYYTLDNSTPPTSATAKKYTGKIAISKTATINAVAVAPGHINSVVASATYTIIGPPTVVTNAANQVLDVTATLNATVNDEGGAATVWFKYGTSSTALTGTTPKATLGAENLAQAFSVNLTGLANSMTYYFEPVVSTVAGTVIGKLASFTTHTGGSVLTVTKSAADTGTITSAPAGINCGTSCTTQAGWFPSGTTVTLTATANPVMNSLFLGWKGGGCSGLKPCSITVGADESVTAEFAGFAPNTLGWYVVSIGGSGSNFLGYDNGGDPITVSSTEYVLSMILPVPDEWIVKDQWASESYAQSTVAAFEQDDEVFQVVEYSSFCWFLDEFNPHKSPLTQFNLSEFEQEEGFSACDLSHVAIVGDSVYWRRPPAWDLFHLNYDYYGDFGVQKSGTYTSLLSRTDPENQATRDIADHGTLYAIFHDAKNGTLYVWTRNLTTGKLATFVRGYNTSAVEQSYQYWSFAINDKTLYITVNRKSDNGLEVWATDLTAPFVDERAPIVVASYVASDGDLVPFYGWGVDNGHLDLAYSPPHAKGPTNILDLDTTSGKTAGWNLGKSTTIVSLVPVWIPGTNSESVAKDKVIHGYAVPGVIPTTEQ